MYMYKYDDDSVCNEVSPELPTLFVSRNETHNPELRKDINKRDL